ncbi:MAG: carboxypeptidase M32 [Planctomycetes bacterium]|nr:carboxypeptidase M32 [Planctomycetota bacterium]
MTTALPPAYDELLRRCRETRLLASCMSLLEWDERTYMPPAGAGHRAEQLGQLAGMVHKMGTDPRIGELLEANRTAMRGLEADAPAAVNVREIGRGYDRARKLPQELVEEIARTRALAESAWAAARKASDFAAFRPWLEKIVGLKRREAEIVSDGKGDRYDALLDEYEPGETSAELTRLFAGLRDELVPLVAAIQGAARRPDVALLERDYPVETQESFGRAAAAAIGFDFNAGRLDVTTHPFCDRIGPGDTRITTRFDPRHFNAALFGILHEAGHGLYEQGLPGAHFGAPLGTFVSMGIHESQSRLWENLVGRSRGFWRAFYPKAQAAFPAALGNTPEEAFYFAINDVRPSFIRVEADEATYNLHIIVRFELERALIGGELAPADVPGAWNEKFRKYLGLTPPNDASGCLQDVHWSGGLIGYFPTYTLGNLYASQLFAAARRDLGDLDAAFARGEFGALKEWLAEKIHRHGMRWRAQELVQRVTGEPRSHRALIDHLRARFGPLYGVA